MQLFQNVNKRYRASKIFLVDKSAFDKADDLSVIDRIHNGGRREWTPKNYPLTSPCVPKENILKVG